MTAAPDGDPVAGVPSGGAYAYDRETAVEAVGEGRWRSQVTPAWNIGAVPNGGYTLSMILRAMRAGGAHPDPVSVTCHYLRPVEAPATAEVRVEVIRQGRTLTTMRGDLLQEGGTRLSALAAFGALTDAGAPASEPGWADVEAPTMPRPEDCPERSADAQGVELALLSRLDVRIPEQFSSDPGGAAVVAGWIRFRDGRPPDSSALVQFADAFPPALFGRLGSVGWVPTIELTVHVRRRPVDGWILGCFRCDDLQDGRMIEDGALWDDSGALVARARQLGLARR